MQNALTWMAFGLSVAMFVLLMNWRSGPAEHSFRNRWLDYLCPYLFSLDHFTDDVYALEVWGCDCRSDLLKPEHSGVLRALLSIELAWHVFFQVRCILLGLNPPRIITVYAGDIVDENGMVALPREAGRGESVLVVDGTATGTIGFSDEDIRADVLKALGVNIEILSSKDGGPEVLSRLASLHGFPITTPWADYSEGFANGPYLSHGNSDPEDSHPPEEGWSEREVPIVETAKVIRAMDGDGFVAPFIISSCWAASSVKAASQINEDMLVWGAIENSATPADTERELCRLAEELDSITIHDYIRRFRELYPDEWPFEDES